MNENPTEIGYYCCILTSSAKPEQSLVSGYWNGQEWEFEHNDGIRRSGMPSDARLTHWMRLRSPSEAKDESAGRHDDGSGCEPGVRSSLLVDPVLGLDSSDNQPFEITVTEVKNDQSPH